MGFLVLVHLLLVVVDVVPAGGGTLMRDQKWVFGRRSPSSAEPEREWSTSMTSFLLGNQPGFEEEKQKLFRQAADYGPDAFFANCNIGASPEEKVLRSLLATRFRERFSDVVVVVPHLSFLFSHMAPVLCALRPTQFIILPRSKKNVVVKDKNILAPQTVNRDRFLLTEQTDQHQVSDAVVQQFRAFGLLGSREAIGTWTPPLAKSDDDSSSREQGMGRSGTVGDEQTSGSAQGVGSSSLPGVAKSELSQEEERNGGPYRRTEEDIMQSRDSSLHYSFVEKLSISAPGRSDADHGEVNQAHQSRRPRSRRRPFVEIAEEPNDFLQWISSNELSSGDHSTAPNTGSNRTSSPTPAQRLPLVLHLGIFNPESWRSCAPPRGFCFAIGHGVDEDALWKLFTILGDGRVKTLTRVASRQNARSPCLCWRCSRASSLC